MKTGLYCVVLLGLVVGQAAAFPEVRGTRSLLARASASSSATATDGGTAFASASALARGDVKAISDAVAEVNRGGDATAISESLADAYKNGKKDAIASALASALDLSVGEANEALKGGATNIANAIARSEGGQTVAIAQSASEAVSKQKDAIIRALVESYSEVSAGGEALAVANVKAEAIGEAIAQAYALSTVELSVQGEGYAQGDAEAFSSATATASAKVIAEGIAQASNQYGGRRVSLKQEVVSEAVAKASASAYASGTQTGEGDVFVSQETVSEAIAKPVARVVFEVLAFAFQKETDGYTYVDASDAGVEDSASTNTESIVETGSGGDAEAEGKGDASAFQVCSGFVKSFCCKGSQYTPANGGCGCSRARPGQNCRAWGADPDNSQAPQIWKIVRTNKECACP